MAVMLDVLAGTPLLTIMIVLALGTLVGLIPFGPVRFGPAGALFVGLTVGGLDPRLGEDDAVTVDVRQRREQFRLTRPPFVATGVREP